MIVEVVTVVLTIAVIVLSLFSLNEIRQIAKLLKQMDEILKSSKGDLQSDEDSPYLMDNGQFSYKAYELKMKEKYDHPKDVV